MEILFKKNFGGKKLIRTCRHKKSKLVNITWKFCLSKKNFVRKFYFWRENFKKILQKISLRMISISIFGGKNFLISIFRVKEFYLPNAIRDLLPDACTLFPHLCDFDLELIMGPTTFLNESRISYYSHFEPNPTSVKSTPEIPPTRIPAYIYSYRYGSLGTTSKC